VNLLAVDSATEKLSVALTAVNAAGHQNALQRDFWLFEADAGLRHSELVMDIIDMLCNKAALKPQDLNGIVCMGGPGSFTGLRIGFSIAKGLALALGCGFAAIPTLDCMAKPLSSLNGFVMPVLDAKKSSFFCALYKDGVKVRAGMDAGPEAAAHAIAEAVAADATKQVLLFGPGAETFYNKLTRLSQNPLADIDLRLGKGLRWGNAQTLLEIALEKDIFANSVTDFSAGPEYIRKSDAEMSIPTAR